MADRKIDPWELSKKGELGGSEVFFGGRHSPIFLKFQESWSKRGHAAREMATVYSLSFFLERYTATTNSWSNYQNTPPTPL